MTTARQRRRTIITALSALLLCWLLACCPRLSLGFSASKTTSNSNNHNRHEIYGIPDSGWSSPHWKWGEATGTGHACAVLCRRQYRTPESRRDLIANLVMTKEEIRGGTTTTADNADDEKVVSEAAAAAQRSPVNFEEVKLILALAWQKGLQNGHGGGGGGELRPYGEILDAMVQAERYENKAVAGSGPGPGRDDDDDDNDDDKDNSLLLVQDMQKRYFFLTPEVDDKIRMNLLLYDGEEDWDWIRRRCSGLVLRALDFEDNGL